MSAAKLAMVSARMVRLGVVLATVAMSSTLVPTSGAAQAPVPYCGVDIGEDPQKFVFDGPCTGTLPPGFLGLNHDAQYEILDAIPYALKSPPRPRRCKGGECLSNANPAFVEARIQAVKGIHKFHPGATPTDRLVVVARIHHVKSVGTITEDVLTGSKRTAEDYFILARRDPTQLSHSRTLFLGFRQNAKDGKWSQFKAADDGFADVCEESHTPLKVDMADFVPCSYVHEAIKNVEPNVSVFQVWAAISNEIDKRSAMATSFMERRMFDSLKTIGYYPNAWSPYDNKAWAPCALGCCVVWRL